MTPHNEAKKGDIAKVVLMPGDPLRAKFIAETFLEDAVCFNTVRGMLGYTGLYNGKRVSVMGSGMGMPSMGIYSYELYHCYDVEAIIRIGTAGGIADGVELRDLVLAMGACTDSNFAHQYRLPGTFAPTASFELLEKAVQTAREKNLRYRVGNVVTSDIFYGDCETETAEWKKNGCSGRGNGDGGAVYDGGARGQAGAFHHDGIRLAAEGGINLERRETEDVHADDGGSADGCL